MLAETVTDIDGTEAGEVEIEANGSDLRAVRGPAQGLDSSVEVEWLITRRAGLRLEPTLSHDAGASSTSVGLSGGVSWKLLQDFAHDLHLDAEVLFRLPPDAPALIQPGDPAQALAIDVRAGLREGPLTLRASAGAGALGTSVHAPLRGSLSALLPFEASGRVGFWGFELDVDGARPAPAIVAFELVPNLEPLGLPFKLGCALPLTIDEAAERPSYGLMVRLFYESERELDFGARGASP
jgi:hypothetical protein